MTPAAVITAVAAVGVVLAARALRRTVRDLHDDLCPCGWDS